MNSIELQNIYKTFEDKIIFEDFNLAVEKGEIVCIIGPSGCGKSTLLNIVGLLEKIDSGSVLINNKHVKKINSKENNLIIREQISYIFQSNALIENESIEYNLMLALKYTKLTKNEKLEKINEIMKLVNLDLNLNTKIYKLSGGQQQRISIARATLKPSTIILADEPTGNLDSKNRDDILEMIKNINQKYQKTFL